MYCEHSVTVTCERVIVRNNLRALVNTDPAKPIHTQAPQEGSRVKGDVVRDVVRARLPP